MTTCTRTQTKLALEPSVGVGLNPGDTTPRQLLETSSADQSAESVAGGLRVSLFRKVAVITQLSGVNFASNAVNGLVVVGLPTITADIELDPSLALWPTSVSNLANASAILLAGSVADSIGPRTVNLAGGIVTGVFVLAGGACKTGTQLVVMRALQGVGYAMHLASSVAIVTTTLPRGRPRNFAFSCLGLSQPLGFSLGLVLGGVLQDLLGWRAAWYIYGALTLVLSAVATWALPKSHYERTVRGTVHNFKQRVDWVGAVLASTFMALLSYLFATISVDLAKIRNPESIVFICLIGILLPLFIGWVHRQVRLGRPALIPNYLWKNTAFASICGTVALSFGVSTSMELFASLFFQEVQRLSALETGLRIIPSLAVGVILNFTTGLFVDRAPAPWIVTGSSIICSISHLLMATIKVQSPYWTNAFIAQLLAPVSPDVLFTVGLIIISDNFPDDTQALAGAVFNTASQFGQALVLGVMQIVSTAVTWDHGNKSMPMAVMEGLRASFWTMFGLMMACTLWGAVGLRKTGKIGLKRD
ncbi:Major facilitator superfamily domain, general substrate transporter [Metarhizium album ARSEF 1941]|uniref:Major facilitator superfamily domain, general substrate transporter n=1 Tax=Metarhizium album (strain ARSEF 1941) TaxID=1081103 RepID=A0A0B2WXA9_METAS|nr:Major facilitator superfamily domain, general substrate transporter [Metarhizium album ARSEF 1941]KHN98678.1 Major facilitator superfamily domain, general substrate transporter [Metarhizium album ARSEF 1941]